MKLAFYTLFTSLLFATTAVLADDVTLLPDDPRIIYSYQGATSKSIQTSAKSGDCSTPNVQIWDAGAAASLSFAGTALTVYYFLDNAGGESLLVVDGVVHHVNNYGAGYFGPGFCSVMPVQLAPLEAGNHTVTVVNTSGAHLFLRSIVYTPSNSSSPSSCSNTPLPAPKASKTPLIAGVVIAVVCVLASLVLSAWVWRGRRRDPVRTRGPGLAKPWLDDEDKPAVTPFKEQAADWVDARRERVELTAVPWQGVPDSTSAMVSASSKDLLRSQGSPATSVTQNPASDSQSEAGPSSTSPTSGSSVSPGHQTIQALLAAGLKGPDLSTALRVMNDGMPGNSAVGHEIQRAESTAPPYDFKSNA